jgi:hypothetical protein
VRAGWTPWIAGSIGSSGAWNWPTSRHRADVRSQRWLPSKRRAEKRKRIPPLRSAPLAGKIFDRLPGESRDPSRRCSGVFKQCQCLTNGRAPAKWTPACAGVTSKHAPEEFLPSLKAHSATSVSGARPSRVALCCRRSIRPDRAPGHALTKRRMRPVCGMFHKTILHRVEVGVVQVSPKVSIIADRVLPVPPLRDRDSRAGKAFENAVLIVRPATGEVGIACR